MPARQSIDGGTYPNRARSERNQPSPTLTSASFTLTLRGLSRSIRRSWDKHYGENPPHLGQLMIYCAVDHLDSNLPLSYVEQDLYSTDPTQDTRARPCRSYGSHPET